MKINKRDVAFFVLGILTFFIVESVYDWKGTKKAFQEAFNRASEIENTK